MTLARAGVGAELDVAIVGAGLVGATLACALARAGLRVGIVERDEASSGGLVGAEYDLRVFALTIASQRILAGVGAWTFLRNSRKGLFREMSVWASGEKSELNFNSAAIGEPTLGYIIEGRELARALHACLSEQPTISWYRPAALTEIAHAGNYLELGLDDGTYVTTKLLVGADGVDSRVRELRNIDYRRAEYDQQALVCVVETELPHKETARQVFLPSGPLAFLPLDDPNCCSIVWSTAPEHARAMQQLREEQFLHALQEAFDNKLGKILSTGARVCFPLFRAHVERYVEDRIALVGDAAHCVHPLAGQGANLGLLDAATLAQVVSSAQARGEDFGDRRVLRRYERWRRSENQSMQWVLHSLNGLFQSELGGTIAKKGMKITNEIGPLKQWIMRRASGFEGDLPALAGSNNSKQIN